MKSHVLSFSVCVCVCYSLSIYVVFLQFIYSPCLNSYICTSVVVWKSTLYRCVGMPRLCVSPTTHHLPYTHHRSVCAAERCGCAQVPTKRHVPGWVQTLLPGGGGHGSWSGVPGGGGPYLDGCGGSLEWQVRVPLVSHLSLSYSVMLRCCDLFACISEKSLGFDSWWIRRQNYA